MKKCGAPMSLYSDNKGKQEPLGNDLKSLNHIFGLMARWLQNFAPTEALKAEELETFFDKNTEQGRRNNAFIKELYDIYGKSYAIKQMHELASDKRFNGNTTQVSVEKNIYPGMAYSLPLMPYLAEVILTGDKMAAYRHYVANVSCVSGRLDTELTAIPPKITVEKNAEKYIKRFREKKRRMEATAALEGSELLTDAEIAEQDI
jgi:hypothetical protein